MKAMILAAGLGSRLAPLTDTVPKCLVSVAGQPMLGRVIDSLQAQGFSEFVVNAHHHREQVANYLTAQFPQTQISLEKVLLDTGGGIAKAQSLLLPDDNFLVHNADIFSDIDFRAAWQQHQEAAKQRQRLATLFVMRRETRRALAFNDGTLVGRYQSERPKGEPLAFCGIHILSSAIFAHMPAQKTTFSIIDLYCELASKGYEIGCWDVSGREWHDMGTPQKLAALEERLLRSH